MSSSSQPYWALSSVYFFYFASLGILMPYLGLYLQSLGYVAAQIGLVFASIQGTKIIAPNIWAWISGGRQEIIKMVRLAALLSVVFFSFMLMNNTLMTIIIISFLFSFFWNALLSQFEVVTLNLLGDETESYGKIRLWGSIGFILAVAGGGWVLDFIGLKHWPVITLVILSLVVLASMFVRGDQRVNTSKAEGSMLSLLKNKQTIAFFIILFLIQASHGPYYSFFSISLNEIGFTETEVGLLWSLGVIAEIVLFMLMQRILNYLSLRNVLLISILLTIVRWLIMGWFLNNMTMLIIAQTLHAVSFGAFHLVGIQFVHKHFTGDNQVKGQALYSSIGFGVGGMCGSLIAGYFWALIGHEWVFTIAAGLSVLALYVAWQWVHFHHFTNKIIIDVGRSQE